MRHTAILLMAAFCGSVHGQAAIFRCGTEYTNDLERATREQCLRIESGREKNTPSRPHSPRPAIDASVLLPEKPATPPPELGPVDKWRFESCMNDASSKQTEQGVRVAVGECRRRFRQ
jgi:hypothetical protein